jgi:hypothetical protein
MTYENVENGKLTLLQNVENCFRELGAVQKIRVKFLEDFGPPPLPPCVNLCHFLIPPLNKYVLKSNTPPPLNQKN